MLGLLWQIIRVSGGEGRRGRGRGRRGRGGEGGGGKLHLVLRLQGEWWEGEMGRGRGEEGGGRYILLRLAWLIMSVFPP